MYLDWLISLFNYIPGISLNTGISISDRILLVTFIGIVWYSLETRGMKIELIKQNDLMVEQNRPYIKMYLSSGKLNIENI